jgi:MFS family permease
MTVVRRAAESITRREWTVIILLVFASIINYIDRSNLSIAAPVLTRELSLSPLQLGSLLSAFSWTYALLQLSGLAGWLSDRFPAGYVLLCGYLVWSVATIATGLVTGFTFLYAARLVLGVGESIAYPCYSRIFASLPQQHRGRANSFIDAGTKIGPAAGVFAGGLLLIHLGWRALFIALGVGGLLWVVPWMMVIPKPQKVLTQEVPLASALELLKIRSAWGTFFGHFCGNYFFYFLLAWLPNYLVREESLSLREMTHLTSILFLVIAATTLISGWFSDRFIARGVSPTRVRKAAVVGGLLVASTLMAVAFTGNDRTISLAILFIACLGYGVFSSNHWAITQTLAGPNMAGRWSSIQNGVGNLSGIAAPWIAGAIAQARGNSRGAFVVTGAVALAGALIWAFLVPRVEQVRWASPDSSVVSAN